MSKKKSVELESTSKVETTETTVPVVKEDNLTSKVKACLELNPDGLTAAQIALSVGIINEDSSKVDNIKACKKVRVIARKVIGGHASSKNGRNAVYQKR